jgi:MOSC domain-containing protein YiiM
VKQLWARVDAVCLSVPGTRVAKQPQDEAFVGPHGFVGDRHEAEFRRSPRNHNELRSNHRQWSAVSTEEVAELCADMGVDPPFVDGALGENLRLSGVRLAELPPESVLEFPSGARLRISQRNQPCVPATKELMATYGSVVGQQFVKQAFNRRGVVGTVLSTGEIRPGDEVVVWVPEPEAVEAYRPLSHCPWVKPLEGMLSLSKHVCLLSCTHA